MEIVGGDAFHWQSNYFPQDYSDYCTSGIHDAPGSVVDEYRESRFHPSLSLSFLVLSFQKKTLPIVLLSLAIITSKHGFERQGPLNLDKREEQTAHRCGSRFVRRLYSGRARRLLRQIVPDSF